MPQEFKNSGITANQGSRQAEGLSDQALLTRSVVMNYRGRESGLAPPPSEPDVRISRIRLSGWWFTSVRTDARTRKTKRAFHAL